MRNESKRPIDILHDGRPIEGQPSLDSLQTVMEMEQWETPQWLERQREARTENFLAPNDITYIEISSTFDEIKRQNHVVEIDERSQEAIYDCIALKAVVRAPSLRDWGNSYHDSLDPATTSRGENAVVEIARKMARITAEGMRQYGVNSAEALDRITKQLKTEFFDRAGTQPPRAKRLDGPRGPIFLMQEGSHRTAAAKLLKFNKIFALTSSIADPVAQRKVWYESLALMPEVARTELLRSYNEVYPPSEADQASEVADLAQARTYLDEIHYDLDLHRRTIDEMAELKSAKGRETKAKYGPAAYIKERLADRRRFNRLHAEAGLDFLIGAAPELWKEHEQRIDEGGYLVRKDGEDCYIRSTGYAVGEDSFEQIMIMAAERYTAEHQDEVATILSTYKPKGQK